MAGLADACMFEYRMRLLPLRWEAERSRVGDSMLIDGLAVLTKPDDCWLTG